MNGVTPFIVEYSRRKTLAKVGYRFNGDSLDTVTADIFCFISEGFRLAEEDQQRRDRLKGKKRGR